MSRKSGTQGIQLFCNIRKTVEEGFVVQIVFPFSNVSVSYPRQTIAVIQSYKLAEKIYSDIPMRHFGERGYECRIGGSGSEGEAGTT